ncbi:biotin-dependent carboxyltransferase [Marinomonas agarivorans]|nr:biotin-dependent carboxyltransferase [Marinomonas agarivorans]
MNNTTNGVIVKNPGVLALIQDQGRIGQHRIGLTVGGPMDPFAFRWANRLCSNADNTTAIEISIGGFVAEFQQPTQIALTGAKVKATLNNQPIPMWQTVPVQAGDTLKLGFATQGCRIYLAFQGGLPIEPQFGSTATVVREKIGGLHGTALTKEQHLPLTTWQAHSTLMLPFADRPDYENEQPLRVVLGYQAESFSRIDRAHFFSCEYKVSERMDRMGYRLTGTECKSSISSMLSEGICHGAIQLPPDGQPIVLLNDRQTIGGYPKMGAMMARDTARLAQKTQGNSVFFSAVTIQEAHAINVMEKHKEAQIKLLKLK